MGVPIQEAYYVVSIVGPLIVGNSRPSGRNSRGLDPDSVRQKIIVARYDRDPWLIRITCWLFCRLVLMTCSAYTAVASKQERANFVH